MNKIKQMLANSDLSFDEKMQILNTISKDNPEFFKEMTENGENILTDEYADMISQMTAEDSDFTVDDVLAFDKKFREMTGQEDAKFELSTEIPEGETKSQQEKFLDSVVSMFDIATPEQIQKLNESPMFNLESYLPELLEYKDNDGNSLFSHIVGVYNNSEDAKKYYEEAQKYCEEHPETKRMGTKICNRRRC